MENPFRYGGIVRGPYFADREEELGELEREVRSAGRIFLVSPRRFGKTCLLFNLIERLRDADTPAAYLDLNAYPDLGDFAAAVATETARALETNTDRLTRLLASLKYLRPRLSVAADGSVAVSAELAPGPANPVGALLEGLDHAEELAARHSRRMLVVLDEFSDLAKYDGEELEKALRSAIQRHEHLAYVMAGSARSVMLSMIQEEGRPFYRLGRVMELGSIPADRYEAFIAGWLERGGFDYPEDAVRRILELGRDVPHSIQRLCHTIWEAARAGGTITADEVENAPLEIARQDSPLYEMLWQNATQLQRSLLIALVEDPESSPLSRDFMFRHGLGPPSSIQASLRSLQSKGMIYRTATGTWELADGFMGYWITGVLRGRGTA